MSERSNQGDRSRPKDLVRRTKEQCGEEAAEFHDVNQDHDVGGNLHHRRWVISWAESRAQRTMIRVAVKQNKGSISRSATTLSG